MAAATPNVLETMALVQILLQQIKFQLHSQRFMPL